MTREEELILKEKELLKKLNKIKEEKEEIRQKKVAEKKEEVAKKIEYLREHKDIIIPLLKHSRTSCSDEHPYNGYSYYSGYARCKKCYLIEILNGEWGNEIDITFDVEFSNIENLV